MFLASAGRRAGMLHLAEFDGVALSKTGYGMEGAILSISSRLIGYEPPTFCFIIIWKYFLFAYANL